GRAGRRNPRLRNRRRQSRLPLARRRSGRGRHRVPLACREDALARQRSLLRAAAAPAAAARACVVADLRTGGGERCRGNSVARRQARSTGEAGRLITRQRRLLPLILILKFGAPPKRRSRRTRPAGRRTWMCGVFRGGRMPPRKIPPAPRTRSAAEGAQAGCVSLRQVSLHKQRKVARALSARNAVDIGL